MLWAMTRAVVLLRGINVGGHNRIKMAALTAVLEGIGCTDVVTYLQSGNVVVTTGLTPARLEAAARAALVKEGLDVAVLVRTAEDLDVVVAGLPFAGELDVKLLHVAFLSGPVDTSRLPSDADAAPRNCPVAARGRSRLGLGAGRPARYPACRQLPRVKSGNFIGALPFATDRSESGPGTLHAAAS